MKNSPIPQNITHDASWLYPLASALSLKSDGLEKIFQHLGVVPDKQSWKAWLSLLLLGLGTGMFLTGVLFFFAYNWEEMHRFSRFAILGGGVIASALAAFWLGVDKLAGKLALTSASVLTGVLLATFGMVYQTGADSYTLFLSWVLLITPWIVISRFQPLWLIGLVIANTAFLTWSSYRIDFVMSFYSFNGFTTVAILALNGAVLAIREGTTLIHHDHHTGRWFPHIISAMLIMYITSYTIEAVSHSKLFDHLLLPLLYLLVLVGLSGFYYFIRRDVSIIAMALTSIIIISTTKLVEAISWDHDPIGSFFMTGAFISVSVGLSAHWLLQLSRADNEETSEEKS